MAEIKLELNERKHGSFNLYDEGKKIGEMVISISGTNLTVYHTEVDPEESGKGYAKQLLDTMVTYVRDNNLQVIPLCPYVHAQFKRHPEEYADIWNKQTA
ncbi:GNAT family N-acetyltransferase [Cytophagaceae bacterium YF14B1]|uniref:GNAT family N-acetyltransferase n=1 Tax=Xanthocytophaga flava TaxID=3048013 RepID=A0AAE3QS94_9BACT|nr:GNAT family N-acetyltransferase [Xanthocytophaga flavus]MDJ1484512.1 GNAT family N-acetyltransferase [Xanthocytophaga flavus]